MNGNIGKINRFLSIYSDTPQCDSIHFFCVFPCILLELLLLHFTYETLASLRFPSISFLRAGVYFS